MDDGQSKISVGIFDVTDQVRKNLFDAALDRHKRTVWMEQIRKSEYFLVLGTPRFFDHVMSTVQAEFAKSLKKPFRVLIQKGTEIPEGFFDGVDDIRMEEFDPKDKQTMLTAFKKVMGQKAYAKFKKEGCNMVGEGF